MARRKISTLLDDHLFRRAKLESVRQGKQVSQIFGEALERYLAETAGGQASGGIAEQTRGMIRIDRGTLRRVMAEEEGLLDD